MKNSSRRNKTLNFRPKTNWQTLIALSFLAVLPARANVILTIQSVAANQNTTGTLDLTLMNTGPSISINSFLFAIQTADTDISFTDATINTTLAPYIFVGNSLFGPDLTGPISGQSVNTGDVSSGAAATVGQAQRLVSAIYFLACPPEPLADRKQ